jgi:hypothetical protein
MGEMFGNEVVSTVQGQVKSFMDIVGDNLRDPNFVLSIGVGAVAGAAIGIVFAAYYEKCHEQIYGYKPVPRAGPAMAIISFSTVSCSALSAIGYKLFGGWIWIVRYQRYKRSSLMI